MVYEVIYFPSPSLAPPAHMTRTGTRPPWQHKKRLFAHYVVVSQGHANVNRNHGNHGKAIIILFYTVRGGVQISPDVTFCTLSLSGP